MTDSCALCGESFGYSDKIVSLKSGNKKAHIQCYNRTDLLKP